MTNGLQIKELKPGFGAEVSGVDVAKASDETHKELVDTFHKHGAMLIRGQSMDPDDLMRFINAFGEPEGHTQTQYTLPGYPKIFILSNKTENGKPIGAHNDGVGWHTDYSYKEKPVMNTMLYSLEVPPVGGDTLLADCVAAYEALSDERKKELDDLVLHHSYQYFMETREYGRAKLSEEMIRDNPDVFHPLIRTHPADGRKALWVSTGTVRGIVGMEDEAAAKLIEELVEFVTQEQFVYRHKWQPGDILTWDNRCTLHTGSLFEDDKYTRHIHRMWVKGDKPY
ncbi:TauD/TfdA dioxygenase family protein [Hyphococcus sp. DH-69]|uniref:TauD/TfdA dioxygenase family protein n=1 Tax=Hyphococcus formosus TaxID=3143534 RepID=UPI00398B73A4